MILNLKKYLTLAVSNTRHRTQQFVQRGKLRARTDLAKIELRATNIKFRVTRYYQSHIWLFVTFSALVFIEVSVYFTSSLQELIGPYFAPPRFEVLRNLLATTGGALIGATAIGFSVVMIAVQLNFARMPHGLFRKLSSDVLDAVAYAPMTDNSTRESIEKHATWLLSVISWIPEQKETILFVENFSMTDTLFELARDTLLRNNGVVAERAREILVDWVFAAGRYSWGRLEHGLEALAALALSKEEAQLGTWLEAKIARKLKPDEPFDSDLLDQTARNLRRLAVSFHPREFETNSVKRAMAEVDPTKLRQLLTAIADMLSPRTKDERLARKLDGV